MLRPFGPGVELTADSPDDVAVSPRAAVSLCLVLHELAANAAQHGALAAEDGRVEIGWTEPDPEHAALSWTERSKRPPPPAPADRVGFGANLIRRLTEGDLGGRADLDFRPEGLAATIYFALKGATA